MMAFPSMNCGFSEQTTAVVSPVVSSPNINNFHVHVDGEVRQKIDFTIKISLPLLESVSSALVQFWVAKEIGKASLLTTTFQPFRLSGNNNKLEKYRIGCLDHKLYVYRDAEKEAAFGLAGRAYLYCTPLQTQNVHDYPKDQRPPCEDAIFKEEWKSFVVPVFHANKCIGVLDFVMDAPKGSLDNNIGVVQRALKQAGLQTSIQIDCKKRTYIYPKEMYRKSMSFPKTGYCHLVPLFGLSRKCAAERLGLKLGTLVNLCRRVGIPVWPYIQNTTARASSIRKAQIKQSAYETRNEEFHGLPLEQSMTSESDVWFPELAGLDSIADLGKMEYPGNNAPGMNYPDSMYDEETLIIGYQNADLNSIRGKGFLEWSLEQTMTMDSNILLLEHVGPGYMADLGGMESLDYLNDDTWINEMLAENN